MDKETKLIRWAGQVQGVGFRAAVRRAATSNGVGGWVRNLPDGTVEALLAGTPGSIQQLLGEVDRQGFVIHDRRESPALAPEEAFPTSFEIRR